MNKFVENGLLKEMMCGANFTYILSDNNVFLPTEYKVLLGQNSSCFVKCKKMLFNGMVQFYYLTSEYKSFASMIPTLTPENLLMIISNLFSDIIDVRNNGFLSCQNIDISFEHIFIDPTNYQVKLVYLPTGKRLFTDYSYFENELRTSLIKLISNTPSLSSARTKQLISELSNGTITLDNLSRYLKGEKSDDSEPIQQGISCRLIAVNAPMRVEIPITKDSFILGKKSEIVDGVISFNKMISRSHCRIDRRGDTFTITDLRSANGTYLNKARLQADMPSQIKDGDIVRMADSDFRVVIG